MTPMLHEQRHRLSMFLMIVDDTTKRRLLLLIIIQVRARYLGHVIPIHCQRVSLLCFEHPSISAMYYSYSRS